MGEGRETKKFVEHQPRWPARPAFVATAVVLIVLTGVLTLGAGCGGGAVLGSSNAGDPVALAFADLALRVEPMPVYGWSKAPEGVSMEKDWLPVIEQADPASYSGPRVSNPRLSAGSLSAPEVEVVFAYKKGWLVFVENFRGDLGDVTGTSVASVAGRPAALYSVNGGDLVQWSDGGKWYGVFGRGVAVKDLVGLAAQAVRVNGREGE